MRTDRLRAEYQIEFRYTLFPLHPDTPDEDLSLPQLFAGRSFDIDAVQTRLATLMADEGLPFSQRTMTCDSRLARNSPSGRKFRPAGQASTMPCTGRTSWTA